MKKALFEELQGAREGIYSCEKKVAKELGPKTTETEKKPTDLEKPGGLGSLGGVWYVLILVLLHSGFYSLLNTFSSQNEGIIGFRQALLRNSTLEVEVKLCAHEPFSNSRNQTKT